MRISLAICLLALFVSSCSKTNDFKKIDSYLAKSKLSSQGRNVAQTQKTPSVCFSRDVTEERLLLDIKELENNNVPRSRLILGNMDVSKFPASQGAFIEKNKDFIQTQGLDLSDCQDAKCLFSKIYPNSNGLEGYLHYYFYLKMGFSLNTVKNVPTVRLSDESSYQSILYSPDELQHFYFLSKMLSPAFQKLSTLSGIYRLPRNVFLPTYGDQTCGLAGGTLNNGYVLLMDNCLEIIKGSVLKGFFIPAVTHEISHRLDYKIDRNRFSETRAWLDLSGWYVKENTDPNGKVTRQWTKKESTDSNKYDGFIRDYAATEPGEDFADSVGHFRVKPDELFIKSPQKFSWISKNLFQGKAFTTEGLTQNYASYLTSFGMSNIPTIVEKCVANKTSYDSYSNQSVLDAFMGYDRELIQCVLGGVNTYLTQGIQNLKADEVEGCNFFESGDTVMKDRVFTGLLDFIKSDLSKNIEISHQLLQLAELMNKVQEEVDPREIFIACQEDSNPKSCYEQKLKDSVETFSETYSEKIPHQVSSFKTTYYKDNSYEFVRGKITEMFSQLFMGSDLAFKKEAEKRWSLCKSNRDAVEGDILYSPFSGGPQYIRNSILNCVNKTAEQDLIRILDKISRKLGVSISSAGIMKFVYGIYQSNFTSTLQALVKKEAEAEDVKIASVRKAIQDKVYAEMIRNTDWVPASVVSENDSVGPCVDEFNKRAKAEVTANYSEILSDLNFHNTSDFSVDEKNCTEISRSSQLRSTYRANKEATFNASLLELKNKVLSVSESYAQTCKKQFPRKDSNGAKNRKNCLTQRTTWRSIVNKAVDAWSEENSYSQNEESAGQRYLEDKKTELHDKAVKDMEVN